MIQPDQYDNGEGPSTRNETEETNESDDENRDPFKYMCMIIPQWADENGPNDEEACRVHSKPASEHPDWKWVVMDETWMIMTEWHRRASYCDPDNFDMYIYNDWLGWGLQELHENLVSRLEWALQQRL
jgi:hypothetical protein